MDSRIRRFRRGVLAYRRRSSRDFEWRHSTDPYRVLVAELLLQRTRAEHVEPVYAAFLSRWPTLGDLACASETDLVEVIAPLGLTKRAIVIVRLVAALGSGPIPLDPAELLKLPGIGRYSAHAIPMTVAGRRLPLVDWVIARVLIRYFGVETERRPNQHEQLWSLAASIVSAGRAQEIWFGVLDLGAEVCVKTPRCEACPLRSSCALVGRVE